MADRASRKGEVVSLLEKQVQAKWRSSGLTDAQAKKCCLTGLSTDQTQALVGVPRCGMRIPYFGPSGELSRSGFYRVRLLKSDNGFDVEEKLRYLQPAETLSEVYMPPLLAKSWTETLKDTASQLWITEGELKAAAGCAAGINVLGLGGVYQFMAKNRGISLLPALEEIEWNNRTVTIVYDSDAATNPHVVQAQHRLAKKLSGLGAKVYICSLPSSSENKKQGLDDFLINFKDKAEGVARLGDYIVEYEEGIALWKLNEEVCYIRDPSMVIEKATGMVMSVKTFMTETYADKQHTTVVGTDSKGNVKVKLEQTATAWVKWPRRHTLESVCYEPGQPPIYKGRWNTWKGWPIEPKRGNLKPWHSLIDYIFQGKTKEKLWFERWLAYPLQHPGAKLLTAAVLWGVVHGIGKSLVGLTIKRIYGENSIKISKKELCGQFNSWAANKQFILGEEITGSDKRSEADSIKDLITEEEISINEKYKPQYVLRDCTNYLFTSNHPDAFVMEDTDRRYFVHEVPSTPLSLDEYHEYDLWYRSDEGIAALFYYLLHLELGDFKPKSPAMKTVAKQEMIYDTKTEVQRWCADLIRDPDRILALESPRYAGCALVTAAHLLRLYKLSHSERDVIHEGTLGRALTSTAGCERTGVTRISATEVHRLYVVRDADKWKVSSPKQRADHWLSYFGPQAMAKKY